MFEFQDEVSLSVSFSMGDITVSVLIPYPHPELASEQNIKQIALSHLTKTVPEAIKDGTYSFEQIEVY